MDEFRKKYLFNLIEEKLNLDFNGKVVFFIGVVMFIGMFIRSIFVVFSVGLIFWFVGIVLMSGDGAVFYLFLMSFGVLVLFILMVFVDIVYYFDMIVVDILSRFR